MKTSDWQWKNLALGAAAILIIVAALLVMQPWKGSSQDNDGNVTIRSGHMDVFITPMGEDQERIIELRWIYPDSFQGKISWIYPGPDGKITDDSGETEFIIIRDEQYIKGVYEDDIRQYWPYMTARQFLYYLYDKGAQDLRDSLIDLKALPCEAIDGIVCFHYLAKFDTDRMADQAIKELKSLSPQVISEEELQEAIQDLEQLRTLKIFTELWVDKNNNLFRQIKMDSLFLTPPHWGLEWDEANILVKFYDINENIVIKPPLNFFGKLLEGWTRLATDN